MRASLLTIVLCVGCTQHTRPCATGSVFVTISFDAATGQADTLDIGLSLNGGVTEHQMKARTAGHATDTLQVDFVHGYQAGSTLTVSITALNGTSVLGSGTGEKALAGTCDTVAVSVGATTADMSISIDLASDDLSAAPDAAGCTSDSECTSAAAPLCDTASGQCRPCAGASDDSRCAARAASTPYCAVNGPNAGSCVQCQTNAECGASAPVCAETGYCRTCRTGGECASGVCDLALGSCVDDTNIIFVDNRNDPTCSEVAKMGTRANPYCQLTTALMNLGSFHFIHVAGENLAYSPIRLQPTTTPGTLNLTITGPGRGTTQQAIVGTSSTQISAIYVGAGAQQQVTAVIDGITMKGDIANGKSGLVCDANDGYKKVTVTNSIAREGTVGLWDEGGCRFIAEQNLVVANKTGLQLQESSTDLFYTVRNNIIAGNSVLGVSLYDPLAISDFSFNTVVMNGTDPTAAAAGVTCSYQAETVASSIVWGNVLYPADAGTQFGSCILVNVVTGADSVDGGIRADPVFVNPAATNSDFHLKTSDAPSLAANRACCIDKIPQGQPDALPPSDYDYEQRPKGNAWDVGADEAR